MSEPVEKVVDAAADVAAEIAQQAEGAEKLIRSLNQIKLSYAALGVAIGGAMGSLIAFKVAYLRAETKFSEIAAEEISEMREHYNSKVVALESNNNKADLEVIVRERGYSQPESTEPPMAVTPPNAVVEAAEAAKDIVEEPNVETDPTKLTVDIDEGAEPKARNIFQEAKVDDDWDWHEERRKRTPLAPYVIHIDERDDNAAYEGVTFTYYEEDDVLCNERDEVISKDERDKMIGETHLGQFGHGSNDASIVYIRNDELEMDFEIVRSPNSYAEEVHGFDPPEIRHSIRRGRHSPDDE